MLNKNTSQEFNIPKINTHSNINTEDMSSFSKGYLPKWNFREYFYKTGEFVHDTFNYNQCIAEVLASKLGKAMGFNIVEYELVNVTTRGFEWNGENISPQKILSCRCKSYLNGSTNIYSLPDIYTDKLPSYEEIIKELPHIEEDLNAIIIFDYITNNVDRHYNNFEFINTPIGVKLAPIYDNGLSLYADLDDYDIEYINSSAYGYKKFRKSKPFCRNHSSQLNLLKRKNARLPKIKFLDDLDIKEIVYKQDYLSESRKKAIYNLVKRGMKDVRNLFIYVSEC